MTIPFNKNLFKDTINKETDSKRIMANIKQYSFAKTNRYFIVFTLPTDVKTYILKRDSSLTDERISKIMFNCTAVAMPQRAFSLSDISNSGHECAIPISQTLSVLSIAFNCFADMKEKVLFEYWMDFIYNTYKRNFNFFDEYTSDMFQIIQMDTQNNPMYGINLRRVFPQNIQSINLDHQPSNIPVRVDVTLAYSFLEYFDYNSETDNSTNINLAMNDNS